MQGNEPRLVADADDGEECTKMSRLQDNEVKGPLRIEALRRCELEEIIHLLVQGMASLVAESKLAFATG